MFKNLLLAVLTISTLYLGWMTVPGLRPIKDANAAAFTTTKSGQVYTALSFQNCTGLQVGNSNADKVKTKSGNEEVMFFGNQNACPRQGQVIRAVALQKVVDSGDDHIAIAIDCCDAYIQNVAH